MLFPKTQRVNKPQVALVHAENVLERREILLRHLCGGGERQRQNERGVNMSHFISTDTQRPKKVVLSLTERSLAVSEACVHWLRSNGL